MEGMGVSYERERAEFGFEQEDAVRFERAVM